MAYPVIDTKATGERIRQLRIERGIRVEDISAFMGFESMVAVYKWQSGKNLPSVDNLYALSRLFGVRIEEILVEAGKNQKDNARQEETKGDER